MGKYAVTGLSLGTYAVMAFSVGTEAVTNSVTDKDAHFFSKSFTWFLIVTIYPQKKSFVIVKKFCILTIRHVVIFP